MDLNAPNTIRINCAPGLEAYLEQEAAQLGYPIASLDKTGVVLTGTLHDAMRLNLHLRTALYVLYLIKEFRCTDPDDLYQQVSLHPWEEILRPDGYLSVVSRVDTPTITDSKFASSRHNGSANVAFIDAHVEPVSYSDLKVNRGDVFAHTSK